MTEQNTHMPSAPPANSFAWPPALFIGVIAIAALTTDMLPLPWPGLNDAPAHWLGLGFGVVGVLLIMFAIRALRAHGTTILADQTASVLVTSGPYARFRNPIYLGEVLLLLAAAEVTKSVWFVVAALAFGVLVTALQIVPEERHLERQFGDAYLDYKMRTRRWI
jgi:protein-S-isoprenylcysteine O-methyltransferase Ste14